MKKTLVLLFCILIFSCLTTDKIIIEDNVKEDLDILKLFIEISDNVNAEFDDGSTALMFASSEGDLDIVKLLIEKGADVNVKDFFDKTALDYAIENNNQDIINLLKQVGAKKAKDL